MQVLKHLVRHPNTAKLFLSNSAWHTARAWPGGLGVSPQAPSGPFLTLSPGQSLREHRHQTLAYG